MAHLYKINQTEPTGRDQFRKVDTGNGATHTGSELG